MKTLSILFTFFIFIAQIQADTSTMAFTDFTNYDANTKKATGTLWDTQVEVSSESGAVYRFVDNATTFDLSVFSPKLKTSDFVEILAHGNKTVSRKCKITFSKPVLNPILHFAEVASFVTFDSNVTIVKKSGTLQVDKNKVVGTFNNLYNGVSGRFYHVDGRKLADSYGTVQLLGEFRTINFSVQKNFGGSHSDHIRLQIGREVLDEKQAADLFGEKKTLAFANFASHDQTAKKVAGTIANTKITISGDVVSKFEKDTDVFDLALFSPRIKKAHSITIEAHGNRTVSRRCQITFDKVVVNPIFHFAGLASNLTFDEKITIVKIGGTLQVNQNKVFGTHTNTLNGVSGRFYYVDGRKLADSYGTVQLLGAFTSLNFNVQKNFGGSHADLIHMQIGREVLTVRGAMDLLGASIYSPKEQHVNIDGRIVHIRATNEFSKSTAALLLENDYRKWYLASQSGNFVLGNYDLDYDLFSIDKNGNVGIGTTPSTKLHVNGTSKFTGKLEVNELVEIKSTSTSAVLNLMNGKDNKWQIGAGETGYYIYDINKKHFALFAHNNGSVGIGTTTPSAKLHVNGTSKFTGKLEVNELVEIKSTSTSAVLNLMNGKGNKWQIGAGETGYYIYDINNKNYALFANNNGHIGIGTTNVGENEKLQVEGNALVNGRLATKWVNFDGLSKWGIQPQENKALYFYNRNGPDSTVPFAITNSGDVGIGTTTPSAKLHVNGSAKFVTYAPKNIGVQIGQENGNAPFIGNLGGDYGLNIVTKGQKRIHVATDGFVHVYSNLNVNGILNVTNGLEVKGKSGFHSTIQTNNNDILLYTDAAHGVGVYHPAKPFNGFASSGPVVYGYKGGALGTTVSGQKVALQWNDNNQVGINCKPHQHYELAVNGEVIATEIVVESGWADFVFDDDYKLMSLEEVEQKIKKNRHLPDIPSEKDIKANGVPVGQMQAKLLQKIEELTLYTINQEKKIKFQNQKMELQDQKIKLLEKLVKEISTK
ncbi:hypothetical protein [Candidatus Uabimicrobium amorphum]|uniref:hypothetical protein n=1 Tax=Uabimicrobium amorphum TaxID=2596890 RepID=UPI0034A1F633